MRTPFPAAWLAPGSASSTKWKDLAEKAAVRGLLQKRAVESERDITDAELADLAQLADGTLSPERSAEVQARVAASPELSRMLARQTVALTALRGTDEIGAPARLRAKIERPRRKRPKVAWR